jgi:hypothetical protein
MLVRIVKTSLIALLLAIPFAAQAQTPEGVEMKPAIIEDRVNPGEVRDFSLSVTNIGSTERTFYFSSLDIKGVDDRGVPIFATVGEPTPYELSTWLTVPQESVTIPAGEMREFPFRVTVPNEASPGAHFGGVFLDVRPLRLRTSGAGIGFSVGTIVSLRIAGDVVEEARVRSFSTDRLIYNQPRVRFTTNVENMGNVLVRPYGQIKIVNMTGREVGTVRVNENVSHVFPLSERSYDTVWERDGFAFGRYQAMVSLVYGEDGRRTITGTASFWILPVKPILYTIGGFLAMVLVMFFFVRMYIRKKLREVGVPVVKRGDYYAKKYDRSASRLLVMTIAIALFCLAFLAFLFLMFA